MKILMPYEKGSHHRALALLLKPMAQAKGHEVTLVDNTRVSHRIMGEQVSKTDVVVTTSPWWEYVHMWISAARYFKKPWVYHPEGWDNAHPIISPGDEGHAKNKEWPYIPDLVCAPGHAFGRICMSRRNVLEDKIVYTGISRFDMYGMNWEEITKDKNYFGEKDKPIVLVCTATLWDHKPMIRILCEQTKYRVIVRQHFTDPVEAYTYNKEGLDYEVVLPKGIDENSPEREHNYDPTVDDLVDYARQLYSADVVFNVAGTSTMEALIVDTPVVNLYKVDEKAREVEHRKLFAHYGPGSHYNDVRAGDTSFLAESVEDIPNKIDMALGGMDADRRMHVRDMLYDVATLRFLNGQPTIIATERILRAIETCVLV